MTPRGFTGCDECEGKGRTAEFHDPFLWDPRRDNGPCPFCSGSGLVPTEKLREEAAAAARVMWPRSHADLADAVLRKVAEHLGGGE